MSDSQVLEHTVQQRFADAFTPLVSACICLVHKKGTWIETV